MSKIFGSTHKTETPCSTADSFSELRAVGSRITITQDAVVLINDTRLSSVIHEALVKAKIVYMGAGNIKATFKTLPFVKFLQDFSDSYSERRVTAIQFNSFISGLIKKENNYQEEAALVYKLIGNNIHLTDYSLLAIFIKAPEMVTDLNRLKMREKIIRIRQLARAAGYERLLLDIKEFISSFLYDTTTLEIPDMDALFAYINVLINKPSYYEENNDKFKHLNYAQKVAKALDYIIGKMTIVYEAIKILTMYSSHKQNEIMACAVLFSEPETFSSFCCTIARKDKRVLVQIMDALLSYGKIELTYENVSSVIHDITQIFQKNTLAKYSSTTSCSTQLFKCRAKFGTTVAPAYTIKKSAGYTPALPSATGVNVKLLAAETQLIRFQYYSEKTPSLISTQPILQEKSENIPHC